MSSVGVVAATLTPRRFVPARRIAEKSLAVLVFLSGFVIFEPAPYELALVGLLVGWVVSGLKVNRYILPLLVLLLLYVVGGMIGLTFVKIEADPIIYLGTTALLAMSAIFFAAVISVDPERRLRVIIQAYVAAAIVSALIGVLGYFGLLPGSDLFTLYGRARGTFQDPNVFGPFLVLPFSYLLYTIFSRRLRDCLWQTLGAAIMLVAIFLTFSRAAWGMALLVTLFVAAMAYINQRSGTSRARLIVYLAIGTVLGAGLIAIVLSLPGTSGLFAERAQLVQNYDAGALGRFDRQALGFALALDRPLGIGPFVFGHIFGEDEHNMWLKGFMVYGWLGGFAYIALAIWTLIISAPLLFKSRPWQPVIVCTFAVLIGHLVVHNVIDNDHWRHLFLIYGILWGAYAAERLRIRRESRLGAQGPSGVFYAAVERAPATSASSDAS